MIFRREIWWEICGIFLTHRIKAQNFRETFRSIFRKKIRRSKQIFRAKFILQTCQPNSMRKVSQNPVRRLSLVDFAEVFRLALKALFVLQVLLL